MKFCCRGLTRITSYALGHAHDVECVDCGRVLAVVDGPREEVFADL